MNPAAISTIEKLTLPAGWKGVALEKWSALAFDPEKLTQNPLRVFKSENANITVLKQIEIGGKKTSFVIKKTAKHTGIRAFADLFRAPKSLRNFYLAVLLKQKNIEVAEPVAALWHRKFGTIYITEYIPDSLDLYDVAFGKKPEILADFQIRKTVIKHLAQIIAKLHQLDFWHRDSKAGNFIIYKDNGVYKARLVDLDGIKRDLTHSRRNHIRTLSKLAETLIRFKTINFSDLYRAFCIYCDAMNMTADEAKEFLRRAERMTVAARFVTVMSDSYKLKDK